MKQGEIERKEMEERILELKSVELFDKAIEIWKKKVRFESWSKWKRFWFSDMKEPSFSEIKQIQMDLLDKEVEEAINETRI